MTRDEAKTIMLNLTHLFEDAEVTDALKVAIEALSEQSIVRCKDCKWAEKAILDDYCVECSMYHTSCGKHGYCHHGERREP